MLIHEIHPSVEQSVFWKTVLRQVSMNLIPGYQAGTRKLCDGADVIE